MCFCVQWTLTSCGLGRGGRCTGQLCFFDGPCNNPPAEDGFFCQGAGWRGSWAVQQPASSFFGTVAGVCSSTDKQVERALGCGAAVGRSAAVPATGCGSISRQRVHVACHVLCNMVRPSATPSRKEGHATCCFCASLPPSAGLPAPQPGAASCNNPRQV